MLTGNWSSEQSSEMDRDSPPRSVFKWGLVPAVGNAVGRQSSAIWYTSLLNSSAAHPASFSSLLQLFIPTSPTINTWTQLSGSEAAPWEIRPPVIGLSKFLQPARAELEFILGSFLPQAHTFLLCTSHSIYNTSVQKIIKIPLNHNYLVHNARFVNRNTVFSSVIPERKLWNL